MIGASLNQYRITAGIGAGGMGEVFRARDTRLNRDVVVKVLPKKVAFNADHERPLGLLARRLTPKSSSGNVESRIFSFQCPTNHSC
jgi:serine/threonine protein kinase